MSENLEQLASEFVKAKSNIEEMAVEIKGRMEKGEQNFQTLKDQADEALIKFNDLMPRIEDLEKKAARPGVPDAEERVSLGGLFKNNPEFEKFAQTKMKGQAVQVQAKATITSLTTDAAGSAGALVEPDRLRGIIAPPDRPLAIRDLLAVGRTGSNTIEYVRETGFTNNAASVGEGQAMAYSDLKFDQVEVTVKNIGHLFKASRNILHDAAQLESYINNRAVYGIKEVEDRQILNGDGTGNNLKGILPQASAFADPSAMAKYTIIDQLRLAVLQASLAGYPVNGFVLNPIDWAKIELEKDANGRHIIGNPQGSATPMLWRVRVVETTAIAGGQFLAGAFGLGAMLYDREEVGVEIATENTDDFEKNLCTIRAYERLALAVFRPEAFIKGTLAAKV